MTASDYRQGCSSIIEPFHFLKAVGSQNSKMIELFNYDTTSFLRFQDTFPLSFLNFVISIGLYNK